MTDASSLQTINTRQKLAKSGEVGQDGQAGGQSMLSLLMNIVAEEGPGEGAWCYSS